MSVTPTAVSTDVLQMCRAFGTFDGSISRTRDCVLAYIIQFPAQWVDFEQWTILHGFKISGGHYLPGNFLRVEEGGCGSGGIRQPRGDAEICIASEDAEWKFGPHTTARVRV
jgi:hypothetical protein